MMVGIDRNGWQDILAFSGLQITNGQAPVTLSGQT